MATNVHKSEPLVGLIDLGPTLVDLVGATPLPSFHGRSLLPAGVADAEGEFDKGDVVALCGPDGTEFARGLTNYTADEIRRIRGLKTQEIAGILGYCPYDEIVHRDNMVVTKIKRD